MSREKTREMRRLAVLMAAFKPMSIEITLTNDENGKLMFSDNVANRDDDADPKLLDRYVLVRYDDARSTDYLLHSFKTQRSLKKDLDLTPEDEYVAAFDLDRRLVLVAQWKHVVTLKRRAKR